MKKRRSALPVSGRKDIAVIGNNTDQWQLKLNGGALANTKEILQSPLLNDITDFYPGLSAIVHEMSESFGRAIDAKDHFTKNHSDEVAIVSQALALQVGLSPKEADIIHIAGHLHDIGKIGVPDCVLNKTSALTDDEWRMIKRHPTLGATILSPVRAMAGMASRSLSCATMKDSTEPATPGDYGDIKSPCPPGSSPSPTACPQRCRQGPTEKAWISTTPARKSKDAPAPNSIRKSSRSF